MFCEAATLLTGKPCPANLARGGPLIGATGPVAQSLENSMKSQMLYRSLAALCLATTVAAGVALAEGKKPFEPQVGQPGKDVIWVPTPEALVKKMHDLAKTGPNDIHYDLGSGDGRSVIEGARRGAQAFGVEYNPDMVELSRDCFGQGAAQGDRYLHRGRHIQDRFLQGERHYALSPHQPERALASHHPGDEARHAGDIEFLRHGRLAAG